MKQIKYVVLGFLLFGCIAASSTRPFEGAVRYSDEIPSGDSQYYEHRTKCEPQFQYYKDGKWYMADGLIGKLSKWRFERLERRLCGATCGHKYKYRSHSTVYDKEGPIYYFECSVCSTDKGFFSSELTPEQITALKELNFYVEFNK